MYIYIYVCIWRSAKTKLKLVAKEQIAIALDKEQMQARITALKVFLIFITNPSQSWCQKIMKRKFK